MTQNRLCLLVVLIATLLSSDCCSVAKESPPNIVVILSDDQGWADIGYNNPAVYSPNLDRLAETGLTFKSHYVMPQCTPTRVALMTGRYPSRFGGSAMSASNDLAFPLGTPTLASMLRKSGYETYLTGKWHLGSAFKHGPNHQGFDHSYGSIAGACGMYDHRYRTGKWYETWHRDHKLIEGSENGIHATDLVTAEAIRVIEADRDKPFFLYVAFHSVHTPLDERGTFVDRPTQLDPQNSDRWLDEDKIQWFNDPDGKIQSESDPEKRLLLASVNHLDDAVGKIVAALDKTGKRDNTLILFSSDNGPQGSWPGNAYPDDLKLTNFNQPHRWRGKKVDVWEGGIHVPGFANWQGKIDPGETDEMVHIIDWFPTLAGLVKSQTPENLDGTDISSLLFKKETLPPRDLYWSWHPSFNRWAVRFEDWKLVKYGQGQPARGDWQLFDLSKDPGEKADIASEHPDMVSSLHEKFLQQRSKDSKTKAKTKQGGKGMGKGKGKSKRKAESTK